MLSLEKFSRESHGERMETVRRRIPFLTGAWNNLQEYDPGMTLAELLSWLTSVQRRSMEEVSWESEARFLTLLGVPPKHAQGARALLEVRSPTPVHLPAGVKWRAGDLVFENAEPAFLPAARLVELRRHDGGCVRADALDEGRVFALLGEVPRPGDWFELVFDAPLPEGESVSLAFSLPLPEGLRRNPVEDAWGFTPLASLRWQGYDGAVEREIAVERDETHALLFSGRLRLRPSGGVRVLRATLERGAYDLPPKVDAIAFPALAVEQRDTICASELVTAHALRASRGELHSQLALRGETRCYRRRADAWRPCAAALTPEEARGAVRVEVPWAAEGDGPELLAVSFDPARLPAPGDGNHCSGQTLALDLPGTEYTGFSLLVGEGEDFFLWDKAEDLYGCGSGDRRYRLDVAERRVLFGDGAHGTVPVRGRGNIRVAAMALTRGAASNLRPGQIDRAEGEGYGELRVRQLGPAAGGRDEESREERRARCARLETELIRAVTAADYESLALCTPGLLLCGARVLPGREQAGTITVAVRGAGQAGERMPDGYGENIRRWLDRYRLAGTRVAVCWDTEGER